MLHKRPQLHTPPFIICAALPDAAAAVPRAAAAERTRARGGQQYSPAERRARRSRASQRSRRQDRRPRGQCFMILISRVNNKRGSSFSRLCVI